MNIAIDISPLKTGHFLQHRVRGTGSYTKGLIDNLKSNFPENNYIFFTREDKIPRNADLIHIPYFEPFFLTIPIIKKIKTIVTIHDLTPLIFPKHFPPGIKGRLRWGLQSLVIKNLNGIITDSESSKKDIIKLTGVDVNKVHTIYLSAGGNFRKIDDVERNKKIMQKKFNLPKKFALYVGDITWNKNLPRLIKAIKNTDIPLVMVGKALTEKKFDRSNPWNQDRIEMQTLIEEDKSNKKQIQCLGFVTDEDLVRIYNAATVFCMPSLYEGFGLPILEAMSCGCPVVTTNEGSLKEVAGNAALTVDAYNIEDISNGVKEVFKNKILQKELSEKGLINAHKFSWRKTAEETLRAYKNSINF